MLTGSRAFSGDSAPETMTAILRADPLERPEAARIGPPTLQRIVQHCLEKSPAERFQSARDLAFDLESVSLSSGASVAPGSVARAPRRRRWLPVLAATGVLIAAGLVGLLAGRYFSVHEPPTFQQLTFRRGPILSARFAADSHTIVYGASWEGGQIEVYSGQPGSVESRPLGLPAGTEILAVSSQGELAVSLHREFMGGFIWRGTLARVGLAGGSPRELLEGVMFADWDPSGTSLAVVRDIAGRFRLEFPIGKVLYETGGWIGQLRVSPGGNQIAFIDHPTRGDDEGTVAVVDVSGSKHDLADGWLSLQGVAWRGDEVWFTGTRTGGSRALFAVTLGGRLRALARVPGILTLHDISREGQLLMTRDETRLGMAGVLHGEPRERDLSWLDWSLIRDLSADGSTVLFDETGEGGGPKHGVYVRRLDGSAAVRLGDGSAGSLSPDGKTAIAIQSDRNRLALLPTGAGQPITVPTGRLRVQRALWFPDGKRLLIAAHDASQGSRLYVQQLGDSTWQAISAEGISPNRVLISPDGRLVAARGPDNSMNLYPVDGGTAQMIPLIAPTEVLEGWSSDGRAILVRERGRLPLTIYQVDVRSGTRRVFKEIRDGAGRSAFRVNAVLLTADGNTYAYTYNSLDSALFLVNGAN
jgi:dipeptidyl aminopeptidase/acylaminoacyl peptidase